MRIWRYGDMEIWGYGDMEIWMICAYQHMAVLGMVVMILGLKPLKKPDHPYCLLMMLAALKRPRTFLTSASWLNPLV
jgi:hypothetical protein